jgi:hypothetical protein
MPMFSRRLLPLTVAASITLSGLPAALAGPGDLNSINNGQIIHSGVYNNTAGSRTTFVNTAGGGLWLHSGDIVRGIETDANRVPTGNGGTLYFRAPKNVVRLDGDIDVSAIRNQNAYTGNGGKVFVDSAYLFQNGNIYANGVNGGLLQFNVGSMTVGPNAKLTANGIGGQGGSINVNATGAVNIAKGALLDTSGKVAGTFDTNVINIEGGVINNAGILRANGAALVDFKPDNGDAKRVAANPQLANNPVPGPITVGGGTGDTATMSNTLFATPGNVDFRGGTIRLVATGQNESPRDLISQTTYSNLSKSERDIIDRDAAATKGDINNTGDLRAAGAFSKNGGTIILSAAHDIRNGGLILADGANANSRLFDAQGNGASGGNGGTISINAMHKVSNTGVISARGGIGGAAKDVQVTTGNGQDALAQVLGHAGHGGQGGLIALSAPATENKGNMIASGGVGGKGGTAIATDTEVGNSAAKAIAGRGGAGGQGGLIVFSGESNPSGGGRLIANGGQGGRGGDAFASAHATTSGVSIPAVQAEANRGAGGQGGASGRILALNPGTFASKQIFSTRNGGAGNTGASTATRILTMQGSTVALQSSTNPTAGSVTSGSNQSVLATHKNEYIRHEETALLLSQKGGPGNASATLSGRLNDAPFRTVSNPGGISGNTLSDAQSSGNLVVSSTGAQELTNDLVNSNINPLFFNLNTLTVLNNGKLTNNMLWTPGVHVVGAGFHDITFSLGGGHISWLANGTITNNKIVMTRGLWSGGSIQVAATQDIVNNNDFINIGPNAALLEGFKISGPLYQSSHAGSLTFKAGRDIINTSNGKLESNLIFFDIHPPLKQNPAIDWPKFLNGAQIGATINLLAQRNLTNNGLIAADALTFRSGQLGAINPALTMGGMITGRAKTGTFTNTGTITASGKAFFSPDENVSPAFSTNTFPTASSFNGNIDIH